MIDHPDQDTQGAPRPSGKLILPAAPTESYEPIYQTPTRPEPFALRPTPPPTTQGFFSRFVTLWLREPSYKLLSLAIALVVIASVVLVAMATSTLVNSNNGTPWNAADVQHPPTPVLGTVDARPSFPTPGSNKGSDSTSQPPANPSPVLQATPDNPTGPAAGDLAVQIVNIPNVVNNNSKVRVDVQTNQPNVTIYLQINYDAAPFVTTSNARSTNDGQTTLTWSVRVFSLRNNATATVVAIATGPDGKRASSQPVTVIVQG